MCVGKGRQGRRYWCALNRIPGLLGNVSPVPVLLFYWSVIIAVLTRHHWGGPGRWTGKALGGHIYLVSWGAAVERERERERERKYSTIL